MRTIPDPTSDGAAAAGDLRAAVPNPARSVRAAAGRESCQLAGAECLRRAGTSASLRLSMRSPGLPVQADRGLLELEDFTCLCVHIAPPSLARWPAAQGAGFNA